MEAVRRHVGNRHEPPAELVLLDREKVREPLKNEKRELISDIWEKRGATYGEKGGAADAYLLPCGRVSIPDDTRSLEIELNSEIWGGWGVAYGETG